MILSAAYHIFGGLFARIVLFARQVGEQVRQTCVSTEALILRFQQGQARAFEALYDRFKHMVYRTALFVTRDTGEAEEAVQETFVDVLRALPKYDVQGPARFETWLYRVTVNRCRSRMRRRRETSLDWQEIEERCEDISFSNPGPNPEGVAIRKEQMAALWGAVDALSEAHREVIVLRYQQGFSYQEIADVLQINLGTVKSRLYHAHHQLKQQLDKV